MAVVSNTQANNATSIQQAQNKAKQLKEREDIEKSKVKVEPGGTKRAATTAVNPKGDLDGKAFMKLLLTELKYQDPTQPMDSEKMLAQTSQLATLETQESTNKLMKELAQSLKAQTSSGANAYAISAIGKLADIGDSNIEVVSDDIQENFDIYSPQALQGDGKLVIKNSNGEVVYTRDLSSIKKGANSFQWNYTDNAGTRVPNGSYSVAVEYEDETGATKTLKPGVYKVEAVKFEKGIAKLKLGNKYVAMNDVKEFLGE